MKEQTRRTARHSSVARVGLVAVGLLVLAACASVNAEDACLRAGYAVGTAAYDQCVAEKKAEQTKYSRYGSGRGWGGPGGGGL